MSSPSKEKAKPFVKWVGGKRSLISTLTTNLPSKFNNYFEPFIGGGALFFEVLSSKSNISDINESLIITYNIIQQKPLELIRSLKIHQKNHCKEYFYHIRSKQKLRSLVNIASRFIYLNKTCFNGLYRVNLKNEFNVPIGRYENPLICDESNIIACSEALKGTSITASSCFFVNPKKNDFVYLDPPYDVVNKNSFTKYSKVGFDKELQAKLSKYCVELDRKGVKFMLSNADTAYIRELYKDFDILSVSAPRSVNCKGNARGKAKEVLVKNYD